MAHVTDLVPYKWTEVAVWDPAKDHLPHWAWGSAVVPATSVLLCHFPPRTLGRRADIRARKPHGQELAQAQNLDDFQRIYEFWLLLAFWAAIQGEKKAVSFGFVEGEEQGKNIQGHQLVFILCSNSNQLPVCREVWGWAPFSKIWESRALTGLPMSRLILRGSWATDLRNWLSPLITLSIPLPGTASIYPRKWRQTWTPLCKHTPGWEGPSSSSEVLQWPALARESDCEPLPQLHTQREHTGSLKSPRQEHWHHEIRQLYKLGPSLPLRECVNIYQRNTKLKQPSSLPWTMAVSPMCSLCFRPCFL